MSQQDESSLTDWLARFKPNDPASRNEVLRRTQERLRFLVQRMLKTYPGIHRLEETDDVLQRVLMRMDKALRDLPLASSRDFFCLAAVQVRRELIDLYRHYRSLLEKYQTPGPDGDNPPADGEVTTWEPSRLARWGEFHEQVAQLDEESRTLFDLIWYQGLSQADAARLLGVHEKTIQRRWAVARLALVDRLGGELPD